MISQYVQTKHKEAGFPIEAIQFTGDPAVHPFIKWSSEANKPIDSDRWCLKIPEYYEQVLCIGDWIILINSENPKVIDRHSFEHDWRTCTPKCCSNCNRINVPLNHKGTCLSGCLPENQP